ncbi:hypothetical protein, partial [Aestuariibaculum sediminum]|uniref:hypothetical protein n=1 Tax=Aestuariibaculum sediminum TaxID=2770637 RepID=UPI001CB6FDCA
MYNFTTKKNIGMASMHYKKLTILCLFLLFSAFLTNKANSQINIENGTVLVNFGTDGDVISDITTYTDPMWPSPANTDDWFDYFPDESDPGSGVGVIDPTGSGVLVGDIQASTILGQSGGVFREVDGRLWIDAAYARDYQWATGIDYTIFDGNNKSFFNPNTDWDWKSGNGPQKNDIVDGFVHLRTENLADGDLWAFFGASTRSTDGTSFLDFEYFRNFIGIDSEDPAVDVQGTFLSSGPNDGRTAWVYDDAQDFDVDTYGDFIISANYNNGGVNVEIKIFLWVDITLPPSEYQTINTFAELPYEFLFNNNGSLVEDHVTGNTYGYAEIKMKNPETIYFQINEANTSGPFWQTVDTNGNLSDFYEQLQLVEFAMNATDFGLDARRRAGTCGDALGYGLIKTRSSDSFTATLKDFLGPIPLGNFPATSVELPADFCESELPANIEATVMPSMATYKYEWYKDGVKDDANSGTGDSYRTYPATLPGTYRVDATIIIGFGGNNVEGCTVSDTIIISEGFEAGTGTEAEYCENDSDLSSIDLDLLLTGADPGGQWSIDGENVESPVNLLAAQPDDYIYTYTVGPEGEDSECQPDDTTVTITINPLPEMSCPDPISVCIDADAFALSGA